MANLEDNDLANDARDPNEWMKPGFILAAVVIVLIFGCGVLVFWPDRPNATPPAASAPVQTQTKDPEASVCGLPDKDQTVPKTAPVSTKWELVGTIAAPADPRGAGPGTKTEDVRTCFARTPLGALYAAVNVIAEPGKGQPGKGYLSLVARGPGRQAIAKELEQRRDAGARDEPSTGTQVSGFAFLNYTPARAVVDLAFYNARDAVWHVPVTLVWQEGDWRVELPPNGRLADSVDSLPDLVGYIPWSGT